MKLRPNFIRLASGSVVLILPSGLGGWFLWLRRGAEAAPVLYHSPRAVGLVGAVPPALRLPVLEQAPAAELEPLFAVPRYRLPLRGSLGVEAPLCLPQPGAA